MEKYRLLTLAALLALAACQPRTAPDVTTFGFQGDVKEVFLYLEDADEGTLQYSFDEQGRVTQDEYGHVYQYDADGLITAPRVPGTELLRDRKGRLLSYDSTSFDDWGADDFDIMDFFKASYSYDGQGRPVTEELAGWEWETTYTNYFEGKNVYPSSATFVGAAEAWNEEGTVLYTYTKFDAKGNWTERTVHTETKAWEEPWEDNAAPEVETTTTTVLQRRIIVYWSD
jgi:hypothetical protein